MATGSNTTAAPFILRLFGRPEAVIQGNPLALNSQKARALLFYLAITGQPHTRNHLATLLWSESPDENARRSLRATLFQLRRALLAGGCGEAIAIEGDLLRLQQAGHACDVADFRRLLDRGDEPALEQAVALRRGPLLEGFRLPDTPLFDEWLTQEDARLAQLYLGALKRLAGRAAARRNWERALEYLRGMVCADPLLEAAQQQLIGLYLQRGAAGEALQQYHQFAAELQRQLGLAPAPETRALFQEALRLQQAPSPVPGARPPAAHVPFVGRDGLISKLMAISREAQAGQGGTILLQGDGGIGKTRLLNEFLARLAAGTPPWVVLQGACSPSDDLASYGPFLEALQGTILGDIGGLSLAHGAGGSTARDQFAYGILQALRQISQGAPLALAIDDLHWANSSTLSLFGLLATRLHHLPLLLIGAVQRPESIPTLQRLITFGRRRGQLQLLALPPLTQADVGELLRDLPVDPSSVPALAQWLHERSDGNPLVLNDMVAQLRADAVLIRAGKLWQLDPGRWLRWRAAYTLPETSYDLVSWRLGSLSAAAQAVLEVLAVAGRPLPLALLADVAGQPLERLLPIVDDLLSRHLAIEAGHELLALPHHLLRETVLHRLGRVRRRAMHRQLAQALAGHPAPRGVAEWEVARHAVAGEDADLARRYGLAILSKLPQEYTGAATADFLRELYDLLAPSAGAAEALQLAWALGDVQQSLGQLPEAAQSRQRCLELARALGDPAAETAAQLEKGELALVSNDYVSARTAAEAGLAASAGLAQGGPPLRSLVGRAHRLLGHAIAMEGSDLPEAERHLQEAIAAHRLAEAPRDLCSSLFELGNVAAQRGQLLRALELYADAAQVADAGEVRYMHALARNNVAYHSLLLGRLRAAQRALAHGLRLAEGNELLGALLHLSSTQGEIHLYLGEWQAAALVFERGQALAEELGNPERQAGYRGGLALAARGQGDLAGALALLEEALLLISGRGYWHLRTRLLIWLAETLLLAERAADAWPHAEAALQTAQLQGRALLHQQAERLRACLLAAGGDWRAAEDAFAQALALADRLGIPLEIARTWMARGLAELRFAPAPHRGQDMLRLARQVLADHQAGAELCALELISFK